ncbi:MAG: gluconeogenesis factor YvcK family protein [Anaerolineae bacterium]
MMKQRADQPAKQAWQTRLRWLMPGLGVKRWLLLLTFGVGLLGLGGAFALGGRYPLSQHLYYLTLQFLPHGLRVALFLVGGMGAIGYSVWKLNQSIMAPFLQNTHAPIPEVLFDYRRRGRGPRIVVIGGGHGQAAALRGLKAFTSNLTAVVTVADDGGSSGRLRREIGILPPGDFRNCIAALADDESLVTRLFQYRFANGQDLSGHSFGNLFITAMAGITGSFEGALNESSQVLAVQGRVLPSTLEAVTLCADVQVKDSDTTVRICGESDIPAVRGQILRVTLEPTTPSAYPGVIQAILTADLVVIGPGSLYTSILPNLLVPEIVEALRATQALIVYVCNVATQRGETEHYSAQAHLAALEHHLGEDVIDAVLVNTLLPHGIPLPEGVEWVRPDLKATGRIRVIGADVADERLGGHHNSQKLAQTLLKLLV